MSLINTIQITKNASSIRELYYFWLNFTEMALFHRSKTAGLAPFLHLCADNPRLTRVLFLYFALFWTTQALSQSPNTGQNGMSSSSETELKEALRQANKEITSLQKVVQNQNAAYRRNVDSLNRQIADNLAKLGQNERALNIALESFEAKYREQNQTIQEFQDGLASIKSRQMLTIIAVLVAAVVVLFGAVQWAFRKASTQQTNFWNEFQASLLKK